MKFSIKFCFKLHCIYFVLDHDKLFETLDKVQGNLDTKRLVVRQVIQEATRFKRKVLVQMLQQFEKSMIKSEVKKQRTNNHVTDRVTNR